MSHQMKAAGTDGSQPRAAVTTNSETLWYLALVVSGSWSNSWITKAFRPLLPPTPESNQAKSAMP